jgi:hypothetical protein
VLGALGDIESLEHQMQIFHDIRLVSKPKEASSPLGGCAGMGRCSWRGRSEFRTRGPVVVWCDQVPGIFHGQGTPQIQDGHISINA